MISEYKTHIYKESVHNEVIDGPSEYWVGEVLNAARPRSSQIMYSTMRPTEAEARSAVKDWVARTASRSA